MIRGGGLAFSILPVYILLTYHVIEETLSQLQKDTIT